MFMLPYVVRVAEWELDDNTLEADGTVDVAGPVELDEGLKPDLVVIQLHADEILVESLPHADAMIVAGKIAGRFDDIE